MTHGIVTDIGAALLVFTGAAVSDYLEALYVTAVGERNVDKASACSMLMWLLSVIGLAAMLEVGWWVLIPEGVGLYVGTRLALKE